MSLFNRLSTVFRSKANKALDSIEDPVEMINQGIKDLDAQLVDAKVALAEVKKGHINLERQANEEQSRADSLKARAMQLLQAAQSGKIPPDEAERLATEVRDRLTATLQAAEATRSAAGQQRTQANALQAKVTQLQQQIEQYKIERRTLEARSKTAQATAKINKQMAGMDPSGTIAMLERMKEKVGEQEALAQAYNEIADETQGLDARLDRALGSGSTGGGDALAALQAELGMTQLPSGQPVRQISSTSSEAQ